MGRIVYTDLSGEEPGPRTDVGLPLEDVEFGSKDFHMKARAVPGSPLYWAIITAILVLMGCVCVGAVFGITACVGAVFGIDPPTWAVVGVLLIPSAVYVGLSWRKARCG
jgi:hypothetical protein